LIVALHVDEDAFSFLKCGCFVAATTEL